MLTVPDLFGRKIPLYFIDYETYYADDFSLRKLTITEYVRDPRFKAHGAAVVDPEGTSFWVTHDDIPAFFASVDWTKNGLGSHHANFDQFITSQIYGVVPAYNVCTMFMSYGEFGSGRSASLQALSTRLGLKGKLEGVLEDTKNIRDLNPEQEKALSVYAIQDIEQTRKAFEIMYFERGYPEREMHVIDLTIRMFTDPVLRIDPKICYAEIEEENIRINNLLNSDLLKNVNLSPKCVNILKTKGIEGIMRSRPCFVELLESRGVRPPMKQRIKNGELLNEYTYALAKTDPELIALSEDPRVSDLVACWTGTKSSLRKRRAERFLSASANGTKPFPIPLIYAGARTNRWSGRGTSVNIQNLPSGRDGRGSRLRQSIIAPDGWRIASPDLSQIELRCGAWLANETELLYDLAHDLDPYSKTASEIYGVPVEKDGVNSQYRHVGKECELSLIYGVGYKKLYNTIQTKYGDKVGTFTEEDAQRATYLYRNKRTGVVAQWELLRQYIPIMAAGEADFEYGPCHIYSDRIKMPSELFIHYQQLHWSYDDKLNQGNWVYKHGKDWVKIYHSKMFENIVQGIARDIIAYHMVEIAREFRILGTVHDEILVLVPENQADEALAWCIDIMRKPPPWCPDLPLNAEGKHARCYSK